MADKTVVVRLVSDNTGYAPGVKAAAAETQALGSSAKQASASMTGVGGATKSLLGAGIAAVGVAVAVNKASDAFVTAGKETLQLQRMAGGTAEEMSRLRFAASQTGTDVDTLARGLGIAERKLSESKDPMAEFGVALKDTNGAARPMTEVLLDIAQNLSAIPDPVERNTQANALFGRSYQTLLPFLLRGRQGLEDLMNATDQYGQVLTQDNLNAVKDSIKAHRDFDAVLDGLEIKIGAGLTPVLTGATNALAAIPTPVLAAVSGLALLGTTVYAVQKAWTGLRELTSGASLSKLASSLPQIGIAALAAAPAVFALTKILQGQAEWDAKVANATNDYTEALKKTKGVVDGTVNSLVAQRIATSDVGGAVNQARGNFAALAAGVEGNQDAFNKLDEAYRSGGIGFVTDKIKAGQIPLTDYTKQLGLLANTMSREDFLKLLAVLESEAQGFGRGAAAANAAGQAHDQVGDAAAEAAEKEKKLADAVKAVQSDFMAVGSAQKGYAEALRGITDAHRAEEDAVRKVGDAQRGYQDAVRGVGDAQRAAADAVRKIGDAQHAAQEATRGITDAQRSYQDALRGVSDAETHRVDALHKVEDAQRSVIEAQTELDKALQGPGEDDQISLERAKIRLEEAKKTLSAGGFDDSLHKRSAELDVRQAQDDLQKVQDQIAGRVPDAQKKLADAQAGLTSAQTAAGDADRAVDEAQHKVADSAHAVSEAQRSAADAALAVGDAQRSAADAARAVEDAQRRVPDAARAVSDAQRDVADAHDAVAGKEREARDAAIELGDKQKALQDILAQSPDAVAPVLDYFGRLKDLYPQVAGELDNLMKSLNEAAYAPTAADAAKADQNVPPPPSLPARALGGPVGGRRASAYRVAENGPELLESDGESLLLMPPGQSGNVVPNYRLRAASTMHPPGVTAGGPSVVNNHTYTGTTGERAAQIARNRDAAELTGRER